MEAIRGYWVVWISEEISASVSYHVVFSTFYFQGIVFRKKKEKEIHCGNLVEMRVIFQWSVVICLHFV